MGRVTFICVRTGTKYGPEYVTRLRNMIERHYLGPHEFLCLTDQDSPEGVPRLDLRTLPNCEWATAWWAKMLLFAPGFRPEGRAIYLDLDTIICGDLTPLAKWDGEFAICENFTKLSGHPDWRCRYGSCVMSFAPEWGQQVYDEFIQHRESLMSDAGKFGDQWVIEKLVQDATLLQTVMPSGFFLNKRDLNRYLNKPPPSETSIIIFGGSMRPENCRVPWAKEEWR